MQFAETNARGQQVRRCLPPIRPVAIYAQYAYIQTMNIEWAPEKARSNLDPARKEEL